MARSERGGMGPFRAARSLLLAGIVLAGAPASATPSVTVREAGFGAVFSLLRQGDTIESRRQIDLAIALNGDHLTIEAMSCRMQGLEDLPECDASTTSTSDHSLTFEETSSGQTRAHLIVELANFGAADLTWLFKPGEPQRGPPLGGFLLCDGERRGRLIAISSSNLDGWAPIEGTINGVRVRNFPETNCAGVGSDAQIMWAPLHP